ncbi:MAG: TRAP transporter substrate-binding protein [Eubacteriales bacterium]
MKKAIGSLLALAMVLSLGLTGCGGDTQTSTSTSTDSSTSTSGEDTPKFDEYTFSLGTAYDQKAPAAIAGQKFADDVNEKTGGAVTINVFTNSAIGTEKDQFSAVAADELEFTVGGMLVLDMYCPEYGFLMAPYLFQDMDHVKAVMDEYFDGMNEKLIENNTNLIGLCWRGPRHTSSNRKIEHPADVKGLKIRMTESPSWVSIWGADGLGATTIPVVLGELYSALQTGVVEASEGPYEQLATYKFNEVQDYLINTGHVMEWCGLYASQALLDSLPEELQTIITETAKEDMTDYGSQLCEDQAEEFHQQLLDGGMEEVNIDVAEFTEAVKPALDKFFADTWTITTFDEIQSFAK